MGVNQLPVGSRYSLNKYTFSATDVVDASGTLIAGQTGAVDYVSPYAGSVVGVTFRGSGTVGGTLTTGTLTPLVMVNGAAVSPFSSTAPDIMVSQRGGSYTQDAQMSGYQFAAGSTIGLVYSKTGTIAPTGALDITAEVWVLQENIYY
jgi:hypothetical protein